MKRVFSVFNSIWFMLMMTSIPSFGMMASRGGAAIGRSSAQRAAARFLRGDSRNHAGLFNAAARAARRVGPSYTNFFNPANSPQAGLVGKRALGFVQKTSSLAPKEVRPAVVSPRVSSRQTARFSQNKPQAHVEPITKPATPDYGSRNKKDICHAHAVQSPEVVAAAPLPARPSSSAIPDCAVISSGAPTRYHYSCVPRTLFFKNERPGFASKYLPENAHISFDSNPEEIKTIKTPGVKMLESQRALGSVPKTSSIVPKETRTAEVSQRVSSGQLAQLPQQAKRPVKKEVITAPAKPNNASRVVQAVQLASVESQAPVKRLRADITSDSSSRSGEGKRRKLFTQLGIVTAGATFNGDASQVKVVQSTSNSGNGSKSSVRAAAREEKRDRMQDCSTNRSLYDSLKGLQNLGQDLEKQGYELMPCWVDADLFKEKITLNDEDNEIKDSYNPCRMVTNFIDALRGRVTPKKILKTNADGSSYLYMVSSEERLAGGRIIPCLLSKQALADLGVSRLSKKADKRTLYIILGKNNDVKLHDWLQQLPLHVVERDELNSVQEGELRVVHPNVGGSQEEDISVPVKIIKIDDRAVAASGADKKAKYEPFLKAILGKARELKEKKEADPNFSIVAQREGRKFIQGLLSSDECACFKAQVAQDQNVYERLKIRSNLVLLAASVVDCALVGAADLTGAMKNLESNVDYFSQN